MIDWVQAKYAYNKDGASVRHLFDFADRPGPSWNYPQTGARAFALAAL